MMGGDFNIIQGPTKKDNDNLKVPTYGKLDGF
jgi:hypothetical protein